MDGLQQVLQRWAGQREKRLAEFPETALGVGGQQRRWVVKGRKGFDHQPDHIGKVFQHLLEGGLEPRTIASLIVGMPYDLALDQVDHLFGDIGGMIADAFQMP